METSGRGGLMRARLCSIALTALLAGCENNATEPTRAYAPQSCARVALADAITGAEIFGAEDLAFDVERERLIISAYDRRAVEKAAAARAPAIPEGGLYQVTASSLAGSSTVMTGRIVVSDDVTGGLRPHGVAVDRENGAVAFINRGYQRVNGRWTMTPRLVSIAADGAVSEQDRPLRCSANDVAFAPDSVVYSFDHAHCGARAALADIFGGGGAGVASVDGSISFEGAQFANGLGVLENGVVAVADTRGKSIFIVDSDVTRNIAIGGAPDNLSVDSSGWIIAAVQPSLLKFALQRKWGRGKAGSRVIAIDPQSGRQRLLFDDPEAALFSAATIAIETPHGLVLGSPMESGLLFCRRAQ